MFKGIGCLGAALAAGALSLLLLVSVLTGVLVALPSPGGSGAGGIVSACLSTPLAAGPTETGSCLPPPNQIAAAVVALARQMADALYVNPACGGLISYPDCYYTWYKAPGSAYPPGLPTFPQSVIAYGQAVCPGCATWANGTYQCVSFVRGAYGPIYPMRWTANAFDLWFVYQDKPGWQEIPSAAAPPGQRGLPEPGDVMVFADSSIGHVAIVMSVVPPQGNQAGVVTFANANSVSPYTTMPLLPDLTVDTSAWPGYLVWGYIRPALPSAPTA
jgi:hypothetical protein